MDAALPNNPNTNVWIARVYDKLHRMARSQMGRERIGHTLSATALIHEVYVRLNRDENRTWQNEREFLSVAAAEMRRVLIDNARRKKTLKRGRDLDRQPLDDVADNRAELAQSIIDLSDAMTELEELSSIKAEVVKLRYFLGLSETETAEALNISRATASRHWTFARAWLLDRLSQEPNPSDSGPPT